MPVACRTGAYGMQAIAEHLGVSRMAVSRMVSAGSNLPAPRLLLRLVTPRSGVTHVPGAPRPEPRAPEDDAPRSSDCLQRRNVA